jgi:glyoxylase-like metal-dependent hydrolase (beta-lactamase superfamily II)
MVMFRFLALVAMAALCACAEMQPKPAGVERMYVIECGENHVKDLSRWTPSENVGKPYVFGDHCYLIKHANGWMLWDTGNPDTIAGMANGMTNPQGTITAFMRKPLFKSLEEIGVKPADIQHFAMSHSHGDHSGNANLFAASTIYMQQAEFDAVFGAEPQKYNFNAGNFEKLKGSKFVKLNGDHDVFGDGTVVIKSTPGHTPGHQSLLVKLPKRGPVLLSGDLVHLMYSWQNNIVPGFNFDVAASRRSIAAMKDVVAATGAQIWVNHDKEQHASIPKAPAYVE